ncbi:MAG: tetratricopeptide repeat protein [Desulfobacterales bacterium]|jgi:tetratricopeptide (TPR) repeat protein
MAQKRISRARKRDLEQPDEFLTLTSRLMGTINTYWKPISAGFSVLLVIIAATLVYGYFRERAETKSFTLLELAMRHYQSELARQDAAQALDAVAPEFEDLLSNYGNYQGGKTGRLLYAQMQYQAGRIEAAITQYVAAEKGFPEGSYALSAARSGLGYAYAAAGRHEDAMAVFTRIVEGAEPVLKADALYQLALLQRQTGRVAEYEKSLKALQEEYPGFMYAEMLPAATGD